MSAIRVARFVSRTVHGYALVVLLAAGVHGSSAQSPVSVLPYRDADRLVTIRGLPSLPSLADLRDYAAGAPALASIEGLRLAAAELLDSPGGRPVAMARLTEGWFEQMGMAFAAGRPWTRGDTTGIVIGGALAREKFGSATAAVGRTLPLQRVVGPGVPVAREELRIEGVLSADVVLPGAPLPTIEVFVPYVAGANELAARGSRALILIGRLKDRASFEDAASQVSAVAQQLAAQHQRNAGTSARLDRLRDTIGQAGW
jgi:hypothetical protein